MPSPLPASRDGFGFADAGAVLARNFALLEAPERLTVSEWALRHRVLSNPGGGYSGPWTFDAAPYLRRPMDCLTPDSGFSLVAVMGPGQCGKSEIGNNWLGHTVCNDPADMIFVGPDKAILRDYMLTQVTKMIRLCPEVHKRQLLTSSADNIFSKQFQGCTLFAAWPVGSQMRARPVPKVRIDDYDALPEDIDGEGNVIMLLSGRQTTFEGFEMTFVNSSPALGADRGIEALVAAGTDERINVPCLQCGDYFELAFADVFDYDKSAEPAAAALTARVVCPSCGYPHEPRDKPAMMARLRWVGRGQSVAPDGTVTGELPAVSSATFRVDGLAGFATWGRLASLLRTAELAYETTQDEEDLRAFFNARVGINYAARAGTGAPVKPDELVARAGAETYVLGQVPDGARCLTAAVDVQGNRFEVAVWAWGPGFESWLVDRFAILALDDGQTAVRPDAELEHWKVLLARAIRRRYPLAADPEMTLPILNCAIDTGGLEGVTDKAFQFWHWLVKQGVPPTAVTLIKGGNNPRARLLPPPTIDAKRQLKGAPQTELYVPNVNRLKSVIDNRLHRAEGGPGHIHFPRDVKREHLDEIVAEQKQLDGTWHRPRGAANETLDLAVYGYVPLLRLGGTDSSLAWVPSWARPKRRAAPATATSPAAASEAEPPPPAATAPAAAPQPPRPKRRAIRTRRPRSR